MLNVSHEHQCDKTTPEQRNGQMGQKGHYHKLHSSQDLRTQSLPSFDKNKKNCDTSKLDASTSPHFNTWPKDSLVQNTQSQTCDTVDGVVKTKVTLSEALQNISLAYSPVTKQLHLVETPKEQNETSEPKKGHKRNPTGSFSSTISSLSEPSTSKSLLDGDLTSLCSFDECNEAKKTFTNFFSRNVFSWKSSWKLFSKTNSTSPLHVASSSALIQHARPSNLPAKTQEEEQRHREEYKAIVAAAKKKEAQNTLAKQKLQKLQLQQEDLQAASTKHFLKNVLPNWEQMHATRRTRDLWWQGLPSSVRGKVWRFAIGNDLNLTPQLYEICLNRARNRLSTPSPTPSESSIDVIQLDISRTFPHLCIFQQGGPYSQFLHSLLAAYVCYRPDVGYVQGMSYIAAILILNMDVADAFICFANLLNRPLHMSAFTLNQHQMQAYYSAYNDIFSYNLPKLFQHFEEGGLTPDLYLLDWIYTVFAKAMPLDVACRVWDVFLRDGCEFIFRTALGILHLNQDTLITMDFLHGAQFLTRLPDDLSSDQLFKSIQSVTTTIGKQNFSQIVDKYSHLR